VQKKGETKKRWAVLDGVKLDLFKTDGKEEKPCLAFSIDKCQFVSPPEGESLKKYGQSWVIEINGENGKPLLSFFVPQQEKKPWLDTMKSNKMRYIARQDRSASVSSNQPKSSPR